MRPEDSTHKDTAKQGKNETKNSCKGKWQEKKIMQKEGPIATWGLTPGPAILLLINKEI